MARTEFTSEQRAEIFVLDRATCSYSGRSLWIADYGVDPAYHIDWADHIVPASRGGKSVIENGATASYLYNYLRGNGRKRLALYHRGLPTFLHAKHIGVIDPNVAAQLHRFRTLHLSDWFLNRAMWHVWIGLNYIYNRQNGFKRSRDYNYDAKASLNCLTKWRRLVEKDSVESIEQRGLGPTNPEADQQELLKIRQSTSTRSLVKTMEDLFYVFNGSALAIFYLGKAKSVETRRGQMKNIQCHKLIPRRIRKRLMNYYKSLDRLVK